MRNSLLNNFQKLATLGLNRGTSGNASIRTDKGFLITPSGIPINQMSANSMVEMTIKGETISAGKPSSEWRFHRDIYQSRPEVCAIVHTHSIFATSLSCLRQDIPTFHYMIALGKTLEQAVDVAAEVETLCEQYWRALEVGKPYLLSDMEMAEVFEQFKGYGNWNK